MHHVIKLFREGLGRYTLRSEASGGEKRWAASVSDGPDGGKQIVIKIANYAPAQPLTVAFNGWSGGGGMSGGRREVAVQHAQVLSAIQRSERAADAALQLFPHDDEEMSYDDEEEDFGVEDNWARRRQA